MPDYIKECIESVKQKNQNYDIILWDNSCLEKYGLEYLLYNTKEAYIANILRYKILEEYGGYYVDADTISHGTINDLNIPNDTIFASALLDKGGSYKYQNSFVACKKGFNFNSFLTEYQPIQPSIHLWDKFCKQNAPYEISTKLFGRGSKIFEDIRMSSWNK